MLVKQTCQIALLFPAQLATVHQLSLDRDAWGVVFKRLVESSPERFNQPVPVRVAVSLTSLSEIVGEGRDQFKCSRRYCGAVSCQGIGTPRAAASGLAAMTREWATSTTGSVTLAGENDPRFRKLGYILPMV